MSELDIMKKGHKLCPFYSLFYFKNVSVFNRKNETKPLLAVFFRFMSIFYFLLLMLFCGIRS